MSGICDRSPYILNLWSAGPTKDDCWFSASRFVLKSGELKGDRILKKLENYGNEMFLTYPAANLSFLWLF